jgi:hypothetical protein
MKLSALFPSCVLALALLATGCVLNVGPASPHPNVMVHANEAPTALVLAPTIQESYSIPRTGSINQVNVTGWRTTLETGFHNAFPADGASGRQLEILQAELGFSPRAVSQAGTAAVSANIRFKARLLGPSGEELGVLAGTAQAREATTSASGVTDSASKAVEAMYEMLASELAKPAVSEPKHAAPPPRSAAKSAKSQ